MRVRVLTLNVWNVEGDPSRVELTNEELRRLDPDLVAFQEMPQPPDHDHLDRILAGTDLHRTNQTQAAPAAVPGGRYGGNAVASRWPHRMPPASVT